MDLRQRPVSEVMRREVVTTTAREKLDLTQDIMNLGRVRHLPVLDEKQRVIGIVSHRDLLAAALTDVLDFDAKSRRTFLRSIEVGEVMAKDIVTVSPDARLGEVARTFVERKIGCVPVVKANGELIGLVTESDLLRAAFLGGDGNEEETDVSDKADLKTWLEGELDDLRRMRDELRVQAHLGRAELRERWEDLERSLDALDSKAKQAKRAAEPVLRELEQDARKLARDLRDGFRKIRDAV
jgi:CBS domain-containing membrane protein